MEKEKLVQIHKRLSLKPYETLKFRPSFTFPGYSYVKDLFWTSTIGVISSSTASVEGKIPSGPAILPGRVFKIGHFAAFVVIREEVRDRTG